MRWLFAPATITALLLAIPSRGAGHVWLQNHPFDLPMAALIAAIVITPAGLYLGWRKERVLVGALAGIAIGAVVAVVFFSSYSVIERQAIWPAWTTGWLLLSLLQSFLDGRIQVARALRRGFLAALAGVVGVVVVVWQLSAADSPQNLPVFSNFLAWLVAYAPGSSMLMRR